MDDLIAFLRARLDERQAMIDLANNVAMNGFETVDEEAWSYLSDPEFAAADVAAKRAMVWLYRREVEDGTSISWSTEQAARVYVLQHALELLALPYAAHPDYREEWKP